MNKPKLLFYCQHSLGMGHLVRSFRLVKVLTENYRVIFINGGPVPEGINIPQDISIFHLPPLGMAQDGHSLISRDKAYSVEQALETRQHAILELFKHHEPQIVLIELFPFGRKKFANELLPLLKAARQARNSPKVFCSLRDILVRSRRDQIRYENRACEVLNAYFNGVLLHCDPSFALLTESFKPTIKLDVPVYYTGFVAPPAPELSNISRKRRVLISAGGGIVGGPLFKAAIKAQQIIWPRQRIPMVIIAGPFLPADEWLELQNAGKRTPGLTLKRTTPGLMPWLASSEISVSQCGYNTVMELLQSKVKALVVPFQRPNEDEQMNRARRLQATGAITLLEPQRMNSEILATAIIKLSNQSVGRITLNMEGARGTLKAIQCLTQNPQSIEVAG